MRIYFFLKCPQKLKIYEKNPQIKKKMTHIFFLKNVQEIEKKWELAKIFILKMAKKLEKIEIQQKKSVVKKKDQNFFSKNVQKIEKNRELAKKKWG